MICLAGCLRGEPATGTAEARFGLRAAPLRFAPPQVNHAALPGGATIDHYGDDTIPLVSVLVRIATGSVDDPPGKIGCAAMTAETIRNGGTTTLPGDELDRQLEARGADLSVTTGREDTWLRLSVLEEDLDWGMNLIGELLARPALPADKLDEARARRKVALAQRLDVPQDLALALYPMLLWGRDNPWGWTDTARTLDALTVNDLRAHYETFYRPRNVKIGFAGAVAWDSARVWGVRMLSRLEARADAGSRERPPAPPVERAHVYIVPRDVTQNVIVFGQEGIARLSPDLFPVKVFNNVLSGGFTSRLLREVRSERGLAYEVYGQIGTGTVRGVASDVAMTKVESTGQALALMRDINEDMMTEPPTAQEMSIARDAESNGFVFFFDTAEKIVRQKMTLDAFGYPPDYIAGYLDKLRAVTPEGVRDAAARILHPDRMIYLVVGKVDEALRAELEALGPVTEISDETLRSAWL
jgi:zinc protease